MLLGFGVHPGAIVLDREDNIPARRGVRRPAVEASGDQAIRGADHDPAAIAQGVAGIEDEIEQHLLELRRVRLHVG